MADWRMNQMEVHAAQELEGGWHLNFGIGISTLKANCIPESVQVPPQSESRMFGVYLLPFEGEEDADLINTSKQTITQSPQTTFFDSATSFAMIRGGQIATAILSVMDRRCCRSSRRAGFTWRIHGVNGLS